MATYYCDFCTQDIPLANQMIHDIMCQKYNYKCKICNSIVPKNNEKIHNESHSKMICRCGIEYDISMTDEHNKICETLIKESKIITCECGESIITKMIDEHNKICKCRIVSCDICNIQLFYFDYGDHINSCLSRTEKCQKCDKIIKTIELPVHREECDLKPIVDDEVSCPICFKNFKDYDVLTIHMFEHDEN